MADAVLSAMLQVLIDRLASREVINFFREQKLDDALFNLKTTLLAVNAVLNDAEEKQIANSPVKAWLDELKDATYDADDLLDEIATDVSRCKLEGESHDQVWNPFFTSLNPFSEGIKSKIEGILGKLEYIAKQQNFLGLKEVAARKPFRKLPTTSLVDESCVYGRDDEREKMLKLLLSDDVTGNEICVIAIVGLGGVGKTTLTQLVYNNNKVDEHFDLKAWVYVSEEFDVVRVTKTILNAVTSSTCNIEDLNMLQVELKRRFIGKKFLLVLDDIWNENYNEWDVLREPFRFGAKGSRIIVTTRNESVASIMSTVPIHHMKPLLDDYCWLLFAKHAFENGNSNAHPILEQIGRKIMQKCKGLPLAVKTLGGLLRSKRDVMEWNKILKNNIWDFPKDKSSILPALRLSYHYLSPHLKQCFAYCSIFPKDYEFKKEQLVLLWMAEGLLQHIDGDEGLEEVGDENFRDLVLRSFFQQSSGDESCFVMHDLINDLAQFVSAGFCFRLEGESSRKILEKTRHLSFCRGRYGACKEFEAFHGAKSLRTFLPLPWIYDLTNKVLHDLLPTLSCIRVLSLSHSRRVSELPESIGGLKHLRYLDLSGTNIIRLPDSTSTLFNLQTLQLFGCSRLIELPTNMWKLSNLRHLNISGTNLKEMPRHMSRLRSLRTLSYFVVGKDNGFMITELGNLRHLRGPLRIKQLQNVIHATDALEANLKYMEYLDELVLKWGTSDAEDSKKERDVLDKLRPHVNLKRLTIESYGSTGFPVWLGDRSFCNMVSLSLDNCKHCFFLPPLGQLPCLKGLFVARFDALAIVGPEFYKNGQYAIKPFRSLETLTFLHMKEWVEWYCWEDEGGAFPCLEELYIENCPKLNGGLPDHLPSLKRLDIYDCQKLVASLPRAQAIRELRLENCDEEVLRSHVTFHPSSHARMMTLPARVGLQHLSSIETLEVTDICISQLKELPPRLQELRITRCPLRSFPQGGLPTTLKFLFVNECRKLELFPPMHNCRESLEKLEVKASCYALKSFPLGLFPKLKELCFNDCEKLESVWILETLQEDLTSLSELHIGKSLNLTSLIVDNCENLKSLPKRMQTLLPSLGNLIINRCPEIESLPEGGLPSNLLSLSVFHCEKLIAHRMQWGLQRLASLTRFRIGGCKEVESFPEEWLLPSTLTFLEILKFPNLKYLTSLHHLTSLEKLSVFDCPKLQCLPEEGLPAFLSSLQIHGSPLLEQRCRREIGEDWPKIACIPSTQINWKPLS